MFLPTAQAVAGILVLLLTLAFGELVSLAGLLGVLLLASAAARYALTRVQG